MAPSLGAHCRQAAQQLLGRRLREEGDIYDQKSNGEGRLAARLHQGIDTRDPCNCGRSRHRRLPIRLRPSERAKHR